MQVLRSLISEGGKVDVTRTAYTVKAETPREVYFFSDASFPKRGFGVATKAKKDALSVRETIGGVDHWNGTPAGDASRAVYHRVPTDTAMPRSAVCVDIRAAYPTTLANLGIISPATFSAMLTLPKAARLKVTGMMGTTRYRSEYDGGELRRMWAEKEATASAFFAACEHVGKVMQHAAEVSGRAFGLFWVDGIFVRPEAADDVREVLEGAGYDTTTEPVEDIRRSNSGRYIFYRKGDGKRTYLCVPQRHRIDERAILNLLENAVELAHT